MLCKLRLMRWRLLVIVWLLLSHQLVMLLILLLMLGSWWHLQWLLLLVELRMIHSMLLLWLPHVWLRLLRLYIREPEKNKEFLFKKNLTFLIRSEHFSNFMQERFFIIGSNSRCCCSLNLNFQIFDSLSVSSSSNSIRAPS